MVFITAYIFAPVLLTSLIKKGRGIWPDEALATTRLRVKGANSITLHNVRDKSDSKFDTIAAMPKIFKPI